MMNPAHFQLMQEALIGLMAVHDILQSAQDKKVECHHIHTLMAPFMDKLTAAHEAALSELR